ncbi:MAG TPA: extracellular solute-binding protein [Pirellulales bacterium]|jgi:sn-glycerol 3-phosphate transport system substrate-binding protein|nr:extracellular solute-binding protein [Pirellulales bacterium]
MSLVSDLYPNDDVLAGVAMVVVAVCITAGVSLLIAMLLARRPTLRHAVLASALVCILATPSIAVMIRAGGISLFAWHLLPAAERAVWQNRHVRIDDFQQRDLRADRASLDRSIATSLVSLTGSECLTEFARPRLASLSTRSMGATPAIDHRMASVQPPQSGSPTPRAEVVGWQEAIRRWSGVALTAWLAGSALLLARVACGSVHVLRIRQAGKPFLADSRGVIATHLQRYLGRDQLPAILISDRIQSPVATGLLRGAVILPAGLVSQITTDQLCDVLIHECAHVVRRDPLMLYLQVAAGSLFWPIPLVHWLNWQLTSACEEICDNYVLANRNALRYAETLLRVATVVGETRRGLPYVGMLHLRGKLESRIAGLIDEKRNKSTRIQAPRVVLCLFAFLLANFAICGTTIRAERTEATPPTESLPPKADGLPPKAESAPAEAKPKAAKNVADPTEIQVWWPMRGTMGDAFEKLVKRFNESQDRVSVDLRYFDGYGAVHKELNRAFRDGNLPDAAIIEIHHVVEFAVDDRIQPLDELIKNDPTFQPEDLLPGILTNLRYRDKLYALPMNRSTPILYYNKDRFTAAGLDPNKPPATWQELREMSVRLTADDQTKYGFVATDSPWVFESMVWSNGGELLVDGKPTFAQSGAAPLQLWADMVHLDHSARFAKGSFGEFKSGRAAMVVDSTALLQAFVSQVDFKLGTAFLPRTEGTPNAVPTGGGAAVIPAKNSPERQAATWQFVTWFIKTQQAAEWSQATGYIPIRESARAQLETEGFYRQYPQFEVAIKQMAYAREAPQLPQWGAVWKIIENSMGTVIRDDMPALRTLKEAEQKVESVLNSPANSKP